MADWENTPTVLLLQILSYLTKRDLITASSVCRRWYVATSHPYLWKHLIVSLDNAFGDSLFYTLLPRYAAFIKNLEISWSQPYLPRRWMRNKISTVANETATFLTQLEGFNVDLTSIKISDWYFTAKDKKVVNHLCHFLNSQTHLKYVDFSNMYLSKREVLRVLNECGNSKDSITSINLLNAFQEWHADNSSLANILQNFKNIETLKLDYSTLSESILKSVYIQQNKNFKRLIIHVRDAESRSHIVNSNVWSNLTQVCSNLKVDLNIFNVCHHGSIYYILMDSIPLYSFVLHCSNIWDMQRSRNYSGTLNLLIANYCKTLTNVTLILKNNRENLDDSIFDLIDHCKNLEYLEFDGVLRNVDFLSRVCIWYTMHDDRGFKFFHVRPKNTSYNNNLNISDIWRTHVYVLQEKGLNFEIETFNTPTVEIFGARE